LANIIKEPGAVAVTPPPPPEVIGDKKKVKVRAGAKYFNGVTIPKWVIDEVWIVEGTPNAATGRAVINRNVAGNHAIMSPVHVSDLILV